MIRAKCRLVVAGVLVTMPAVAGCGKVIDAFSNAVQVPESRVDRSTETPPKEANLPTAFEKMSDVVSRCLNKTSRAVLEAERAYLETTKPDEPATGRSRLRRVRDVISTERCVEALRDFVKRLPAMPELNPIVIEYADVIEDVTKTIRQYDQYLAAGDYEDDGWERGRTLHAAIVPLFRRHHELYDQVSESVRAIEQEHDKGLLARLSGDPERRLEYLVEKSRLSARSYADLAGTMHFDPRTRTFGGVDATALLEASNAVAETLDALREELAASQISHRKRFGLERYLDKLETFVIACKNLRRRVEAGVKLSRSEEMRLKSRSPPKDTPPGVVNAWQGLLQSYNGLS